MAPTRVGEVPFRSISDSKFLPPSSLNEWREALQKVKSLYLKRQYKPCTACASELLNNAKDPLHPVHRTFLRFHIAISYEMLGRTAHHYSNNKIPLLRLALDNFLACNEFLPPLINLSDAGPEPGLVSDDDSSLTSEGSDQPSIIDDVAGSLTRMIELSLESPFFVDNNPFISRESSPEQEDINHTLGFRVDSMNSLKLVPLPLQIRKVRQKLSEENDPRITKNESGSMGPFARPYAGPFEITGPADSESGSRKSGDDDHCSSFNGAHISSSAHESNNPVSWRQRNVISRYNSNVLVFGAQLRSDIAAVSALIDTVAELQRIHRATKIQRSVSFWSFTPAEEWTATEGKTTPLYQGISLAQSWSFTSPGVYGESKQQRISRLRAGGWNTVGLRNKDRGWKGKEYYQTLCLRALSDFYDSTM